MAEEDILIKKLITFPYQSLNDNYQIIQILGEGAFSRVYLGYKRDEPSIYYAIKEYQNIIKHLSRKEYKLAEQEIELLTTEINILAKFSSENCTDGILCYKEFFLDPTLCYLYVITEYIHGTTLSDILKVTLNMDTIYDILYKIIKALALIHKYDIIHGDIKPDNIMIRENKQPVLIDFGLSCLKQKCYARGSLLYMAPEIFSTSYLSTKSDIWSLAISFYEILFGDPYPTSVTNTEIASAQQTTVLTFKTNHQPLNTVLSAMLVLDQTQRPSAQELLDKYFI